MFQHNDADLVGSNLQRVTQLEANRVLSCLIIDVLSKEMRIHFGIFGERPAIRLLCGHRTVAKLPFFIQAVILAIVLSDALQFRIE